jgi:hypothetical protein
VIDNSTHEGKVRLDLAGGPPQDAPTMREVLEGSSLQFQVVYRERGTRGTARAAAEEPGSCE